MKRSIKPRTRARLGRTRALFSRVGCTRDDACSCGYANGDGDGDGDGNGNGNGDDPSRTTIYLLLPSRSIRLRSSRTRPSLAIFVGPSALSHSSVPCAPSRVLPFLSTLSRSIRSLCTIRLPFSVSNTTHGPPGGLVRGSILTAGVARTPILSVPVNRRVSSKVSLRLLLLLYLLLLLHQPCSSNHPRVILYDQLRRHPSWPPHSITLCLTPSMSSVTQPWWLPPCRPRRLTTHASSFSRHQPQRLSHSTFSFISILPHDQGTEKTPSSFFRAITKREPGPKSPLAIKEGRACGWDGRSRRVSYDVEPGCDVGHRNRCLRALRELRDAPDTREQGTRENGEREGTERGEGGRERERARSRLGSDRAKLCICRR